MGTDTTPSQTAAPNWSTQTEEIHCPLCEYNLRGLTEPRCPECGYQFEWIKLLDPTQRMHPYLFEHHPERNFTSFLQTIIGSLAPRRFWMLLHPKQASRPRRLVMYWVLNLLLVLIPSAVMAAPYMVNYYTMLNRTRVGLEKRMATNPNPAQVATIIRNYGSVQAYIDLLAPTPFGLESMHRIQSRLSRHLPLLTAGIAYLIWPWCGVLLLMIYQQSMKRARIHRAHVLRCLIYSADGALLFLAGVLPMAAMFAFYYVHYQRLPLSVQVYPWLQKVGLIAVPLVWLTSTYRMIIAYRRYLQFPHAAAVVIATEIILFLGLLCMLMLMMNPMDLLRLLRLI